MIERGVSIYIGLELEGESWFAYARFDGAEHLNQRMGPFPTQADAELIAQYMVSLGRKLGAVDIPEGKPN